MHHSLRALMYIFPHTFYLLKRDVAAFRKPINTDINKCANCFLECTVSLGTHASTIVERCSFYPLVISQTSGPMGRRPVAVCC